LESPFYVKKLCRYIAVNKVIVATCRSKLYHMLTTINVIESANNISVPPLPTSHDQSTLVESSFHYWVVKASWLYE